ncbi:MAG: hypothetical protein K1Y02_10605 [Candidatus Hydrogenedentes bacterium]|nr:hypothetical protein [Candidatus Hydrogenedentota bacterium]
MRTWKTAAIVMSIAVGIVAPVMVGCNLLTYQICVNNQSSYDLIEVNVVALGAGSWGSNDLTGIVGPGQTQDIKGFSAGDYMVRGVFDVADSQVCEPVINDEYIVTNTNIDITTTNVCIDYNEQYVVQNGVKAPGDCVEIYGAVRFEI